MLIKKMFLHNKILSLLAILLLIIYSFNGVLISAVVYYAGKFNSKTEMKTIIIYTILALFSWGLIYFAHYLLTVTQAKVLKKNNIDLKTTLVHNIWYSRKQHDNSSKVISMLMNDLKLLENDYFMEFFSVIEDILVLIVSLSYMLYLNKIVSIFFILFSFLPLVTPIFFSKRLNESTKIWTNKNKIVVDKIKDFFQGFSVVQTYGIQSRIFSLIKKRILELENSQYTLTLNQALAQFAGSLVAGVGFIVPFSVGCILVVRTNSFSFTTLLAIFLASDRVISPIMNAVSSFNQITGTKNIRLKIINILNQHDISNLDIHPTFSKAKNHYEFIAKNIDYQINENQNIGFSLSISMKDKILIYGESGVGKSTLLKVLNGNIFNYTGQYFENIDHNIQLERPYSEVAYINQTPYIFNASIKNNITLFSPKVDNHRLTAVLQKVRLNDIAEGDEFLDHDAGENGTFVSGGQRQRIEIARALYADKKLILADEVTANLDKGNADVIRNLLFELPQPVVEVAHHYNLKDKRYTKIYELTRNGKLLSIK
jgi:ABC-type multidrug transport system, ATPase and permease components